MTSGLIGRSSSNCDEDLSFAWSRCWLDADVLADWALSLRWDRGCARRVYWSIPNRDHVMLHKGCLSSYQLGLSLAAFLAALAP